MTGPEPEHAVAVILVRAAEAGLEVFLIRGPEPTLFTPGTYFFPGGKVVKEDCAEKILKRSFGLAPSEAQRKLGPSLRPRICLAHWVAAIRELFLQAGILLAVDESGRPLKMEGRKQELAEKREALAQGRIDFHGFLQSEGLLCDAASLCYFSRWLTPEKAETRFDARFYLARLPADQAPVPAHERLEALWVAPERALKLVQERSLPLSFPVYATVRALADFDSLEGLAERYRLR